MKYRFTNTELEKYPHTKDAIALLDLLNERCHKHIKMVFTKASGGRANLTHTQFTVPKHALEKFGETYLYYYVIHEFTHCYANNGTHDGQFKRTERKLLALFGITIDYAKAYPRALYANGEKVYQKHITKSKR